MRVLIQILIFLLGFTIIFFIFGGILKKPPTDLITKENIEAELIDCQVKNEFLWNYTQTILSRYPQEVVQLKEDSIKEDKLLKLLNENLNKNHTYFR